MPFEILRNDICSMSADAIVNSACPKPCVGSGVDLAINRQAGPRLLQARQALGYIPVGEARATPAFDLPATHVIHAVSPLWQGGDQGEAELLSRCYSHSLELARELGCESVAFPLLAAGNLGFPRELALRCAISAISDFLVEHEMLVYLVVYNKSAFVLSGKLFTSVKSFIDENYVADIEAQIQADNSALPSRGPRDILLHKAPAPAMDSPREERSLFSRRRKKLSAGDFSLSEEERLVPTAAPCGSSLEDMLKNLDAGFSESLIRLIDERGLTDPQVYKRANIDRKLFSKIKNNKDYRPGKTTAVAFAIALELDMEETRQLLARAGYALSRSSKFDLIVEYFIQRGCYDIYEINQALFEFDQSLIGG